MQLIRPVHWWTEIQAVVNLFCLHTKFITAFLAPDIVWQKKCLPLFPHQREVEGGESWLQQKLLSCSGVKVSGVNTCCHGRLERWHFPALSVSCHCCHLSSVLTHILSPTREREVLQVLLARSVHGEISASQARQDWKVPGEPEAPQWVPIRPVFTSSRPGD